MKKLYTNFLMSLLGLFMAVSASAQADFTGRSVQSPAEDYSTQPIVFSLSEVAAKLNTNAADLVEALNAWVASYDATAEEQNNMFFLVEGDKLNDKYNCDGTNGQAGCFWLNTSGNCVPYADGSWYNDFYWTSVENDSLVIAIGQKPNSLVYSGKYTANFVLGYAGFEASFEITLEIESDLVKVDMVLSNLDIVAEKEVTIEQYPRTSYDADEVKVDVSDIAEQLGCDLDFLSSNLQSSLYCATFDNSEETADPTVKGDTLTNRSTAQAIGFWLNTCTDANGDETGEVVVAEYSGSCKYYAEAYTLASEEYELDGETKGTRTVLTCNIGQYPKNLSAGQEYFHTIYITYGSKAYAVKYNLHIIEKPQSGIDAMEVVGNKDVVMDQYPGYNTGSFELDIANITELLGCEASELKLQYWANEDHSAISDDHTAGNQGCWLSATGVVSNWGSAPVYVENTTSGDFSNFASGNMENIVSPGQKYDFSFFVTNADATKAYQVNVTINIIAKETIDDDQLTEVASKTYDLQAVPSSSVYLIDNFDLISLEEIEELIGTRSPTFMTWTAPDEEGKSAMSDDYNCTTEGAGDGFWMSDKGYLSTWGNSNSRIGVGYLANGQFQLFQYPGRMKLGDEWTSKFALVNDGKYITVTLNIKFVETVVKKTVVGEETVYVKGGDETVIDFSAMLEATGMAIDDMNDFQVLTAKDATGEWITPVDPYNGVNFKGGVAIDDTGFEQSVSINVDTETTSTIEVVLGDGYTLSGSVNLDIAILYDSKMYIYHLVVCDAETWASVEASVGGIKADTVAKAIYNVAGQRVNKTVKGLYIVGNRKVAVR